MCLLCLWAMLHSFFQRQMSRPQWHRIKRNWPVPLKVLALPTIKWPEQYKYFQVWVHTGSVKWYFCNIVFLLKKNFFTLVRITGFPSISISLALLTLMVVVLTLTFKFCSLAYLLLLNPLVITRLWNKLYRHITNSWKTCFYFFPPLRILSINRSLCSLVWQLITWQV